MTVHVKKLHLLYALIVALSLASYPANYAIMKAGVGGYNNDPKCEWRDGEGKFHHGPSVLARSCLLVISPLSAPVSGIVWIAQTTASPQADTDQTAR